MVAVGMGDADAVYRAGRDPRTDQLPLRALAGIKQDGVAVKSQQRGMVRPRACRHLAGSAERDYLAS